MVLLSFLLASLPSLLLCPEQLPVRISESEGHVRGTEEEHRESSTGLGCVDRGVRAQIILLWPLQTVRNAFIRPGQSMELAISWLLGIHVNHCLQSIFMLYLKHFLGRMFAFLSKNFLRCT